MHPIGGEKTILDPLPQTVLIDRIAEVSICIPVVLSERRRGHSELIRRLKIFKDLPPVALIAGASPVTLIDDDEVKESRVILAVKSRAALILGDRLVDGEVHLPALVGFPVFDLPPGIAEGGEDLILGIIDKNIAIGEIKDFRTSVLTGPVPARRPEFPANMKRDVRLACPGGHGEKNPPLVLQDRLDRAVHRDFLIITGALS